MTDAALAQEGVVTDPTPHVEYITLTVRGTPAADTVETAMGMITNVTHSIGQKDSTANLTITVGFSASAWPLLFPDDPMPAALHPFVELRDGDRHFPSTPGDIFFMIKSERIDLNYQAAKYLVRAFAGFTDILEDTQGYQYLDNRDLIDFVDGTENPAGSERVQWVVSDEEPYRGASHLIVQRYVHHADEWDALPTVEAEGVIGRTQLDDIELPDEEKKPYAHNVKSKVHDTDGEELKMLRQNRAFGTAERHGTMFVGFAADPAVIEASLRGMITADQDGNYDKLLDFVVAETGLNLFVPPRAFIARYA